MHGLREEGDKDARKRFHLPFIREVLSQLLQIPEEMSITVLDLEGQLIVGVIPVHHEDAGKIFVSEDALRDRRRSRIFEQEDAQKSRTEEPGIARLSVIS